MCYYITVIKQIRNELMYKMEQQAFVFTETVKIEVGDGGSLCRLKNDFEIACTVQRDSALLLFFYFAGIRRWRALGPVQKTR